MLMQNTGFMGRLFFVLIGWAIAYVFSISYVPEFLHSAYTWGTLLLFIAMALGILPEGMVFKTVVVYTAPFFAWALSEWFVTTTPLMSLMNPNEAEVIVKAISPAVISIIAFGYWYFSTRFVEFSRVAVLPIALGVNVFNIALLLVEGQMTQVAFVWALFALALSLFINAFTSEDKKEVIMKVSGVTALTGVFMSILVNVM